MVNLNLVIVLDGRRRSSSDIQICPISPTGTDLPRIDDVFVSNINCPSH